MTNNGTVVITGGNSGIGLEAAVAIAAADNRVVIAVRSATKGATAVDEIIRRSGNSDVEALPLDLASLDSIRSFAKSWNDRDEPIRVLLNNAGLVMKERSTTEDGFEMTFGVNHLGHFLLTNLLQDAITASGPGARIINVASGAHKGARNGLDFDDLMWEHRKYSGLKMGMGAYAASKLANIMFTRHLAKRLAATGITANALHPGMVASNFAREGDGGRIGEIAMTLIRPVAITSAKGALTSIYLATSPEVADTSGQYFYKCKPARFTRWAADEVACARLWDISADLVGLT